MRALLIANPNSTSQTPAVFSRLIPVLRSVAGLELRTVFTQYSGHAEEICREVMVARRAPEEITLASPLWDQDAEDNTFAPDIVLAVGGDGTVNEVINGLLGSVADATTDGELSLTEDIPIVGVIPTGSANVFARALGFPGDAQDATAALARCIAQGDSRDIDLGTWKDKWFAVNAGFGIDADVIAGVEKARSRGFAATPLRYMRVALGAWLKMRKAPPKIEVSTEDGQGNTIHLANLPLCIASNTNPWTFLGPLPVISNPRNSFDVGLSIYALSSLTGLGGVLGMLHLVGVGKHSWAQGLVGRRSYQIDDVMQVELDCHEERRFQVDGEYAGKFERVTLGAIPRALRVFAPRTKIDPTPISKVRLALGFFAIRV